MSAKTSPWENDRNVRDIQQLRGEKYSSSASELAQQPRIVYFLSFFLPVLRLQTSPVMPCISITCLCNFAWQDAVILARTLQQTAQGGSLADVPTEKLCKALRDFEAGRSTRVTKITVRSNLMGRILGKLVIASSREQSSSEGSAETMCGSRLNLGGRYNQA